MSTHPDNIAVVKDRIALGGGARFWAYISPQNKTAQSVTRWEVRIEQTDGNWFGVITSDDPEMILETPNLSGVFRVRVTASGPKFDEKVLAPTSDSKADIGCNNNCAAMVGIVATEEGTDANYWTTWDAFCN